MNVGRYITENTLGIRPNVGSLTLRHWVAVVLAASTGSIHLYLYWQQAYLPFLFAGVVFFGAVGLLLTTFDRRLLYALGIPFTAGQLVIWYLMGMSDMQIAIVDKPIQALLIGLLAYLLVTEWPNNTAEQHDAAASTRTTTSED